MGRVVDAESLAVALAAARREGQRVVLTNGCFDLLHVGHLRLLQACKELGDLLVVGVNGDNSVTLLKGPPRPFVPAVERAELVAGLAPVDLVAIFPERTAERLASDVQPAVYVKGADYAIANGAGVGIDAQIDEQRLPEAKVVRAGGGKVVLLPLVPDRSSSALAERIAKAGNDLPRR
jgi:rfaE bifunctional protein nucleotidyltransferase chain/domain